MDVSYRIERFIFFILIFSVISQLGKHFWPDFSFVSGIRVDYLAPTVYITDILLVILFVFFVFRVFQKKELFGCLSFFSAPQCIFFFLLLIAAASMSVSPWAAAYGSIKIIEYAFLGWYVSVFFRETERKSLIDTLALGAFIVSVLALWQFILQRSVGGFWYFFGERTFSQSTIGIATIHYGDSLILRPYATFPHPNVLAFFLFFVLLMIYSKLEFEKDRIEKTLLIIICIIANIALFLTFTRSVLVMYALYVMYVSMRFGKRQLILAAIPVMAVIVFYLSVFQTRFFNSGFFQQDAILRVELLKIAVLVFLQYPYLGVGVNNFFYHESAFQKTISPTLLQPVHNIYLLVLTQAGIAGAILFIWFMVKTIKHLIVKIRAEESVCSRRFFESLLIMLFATLFIGFFDHFLLTLQQGQLLFALLLGLSWAE